MRTEQITDTEDIDAEREGMAAGRAGAVAWDNPHSESPDDAKKWEAGRVAGRQERLSRYKRGGAL